MSSAPVLLVDGMSVMKTTAGAAATLDRGYTFSFLTQLTAAIKKLKPSLVIVCWEGGFGGREKIYEGYKADRRESAPSVRSQRDELQQLLAHLGVEQAMCPGFEADDVIASLANTLPTPVIIFSNDKDFLQLVSERVSVYQKPRLKGPQKRTLITLENFDSMVGFQTPGKWALAQFALGDGVDGVPKVDKVTPAKVHAYLHGMHLGPKTVEFYDEVFSGSNKEYERNKVLMDLRTVRELSEPLKITLGELSAERTVNYLYELGFASIVAKFHDWFAVYEGVFHSDVSD